MALNDPGAFPPPGPEETSTLRKGVAYGLGASVWWGLGALYYGLLTHVPPTEVLAHRVVWSGLVLGLCLRWTGGWEPGFRSRLRGTFPILCFSALLLGGRWYVFVWAVSHSQVLQISLAYFLSPLAHLLLGRLILRERLRPLQRHSAFLAALAVGILCTTGGRPPTTAFALTGLFAVYNLVRKRAPIGALPGLVVEMAVLAPAALAYLLLQGGGWTPTGVEGSTGTLLLLLGSGLFTAVPLLWFVEAARRLRMTTLGFLHYITPTMHFLVAVLAFREDPSASFLSALGVTWIALALFSLDALRHGRRNAPPPPVGHGRGGRLRPFLAPASRISAANFTPAEEPDERMI